MSCSSNNSNKYTAGRGPPVPSCADSFEVTGNKNVGTMPCCDGLKRCIDGSRHAWCTYGSCTPVIAKEKFTQPGCGPSSYNMSPIGIL